MLLLIPQQHNYRLSLLLLCSFPHGTTAAAGWLLDNPPVLLLLVSTRGLIFLFRQALRSVSY
jgi:hypothetical protein